MGLAATPCKRLITTGWTAFALCSCVVSDYSGHVLAQGRIEHFMECTGKMKWLLHIAVRIPSLLMMKTADAP